MGILALMNNYHFTYPKKYFPTNCGASTIMSESDKRWLFVSEDLRSRLSVSGPVEEGQGKGFGCPIGKVKERAGSATPQRHHVSVTAPPRG